MKRKPKLPAIFRRKNAVGKETGNCLIKIDGKNLNLGTSDYAEAEKRRAEAVRHGRRNFVDEIDEAAAATMGGEGEGPTGAHTPGTAGATPAPATASAAPPGGSGSPPEQSAAAQTAVQPDAYIPPPAPPLQLPAADAAAEAAATNDAAAEGETASEAAGAAAAGPEIPDDVLDGMLEMGALLLVDLQLGMQAAIIRKGLKVEPGKVPPEAPQRSAAAKAWVQQLKIWFPSAVAMPPWGWALLIPASCAVQQIMTATPLKKDAPAQPRTDGGLPTEAAAAA